MAEIDNGRHAMLSMILQFFAVSRMLAIFKQAASVASLF